MPLVAAAAIGAAGLVAGAKISSKASNRAARLTTDAANHDADVQAQSAREAETFARQQAQNQYLNDEAIRRANYDQWAAQQARFGSIQERLGLGPRNTPAYVPGVNPGYVPAAGGPPPSAPPSGPPGAPTSGTQPPVIRDAYGRVPGDPEYGIPRPPRTTAPPATPMVTSGQAQSGQAQPGSIASYLPPTEENLPPPAVRYRNSTPGSVASYVRRAG